MMSRISSRHGWLLYAGPALGNGAVISGDVLTFEMSMDQSLGGSSLRATFELPGATLIQGRPLESMMWEALWSWPEPGQKDGRQWPPEMKALLELAKRHPEEYQELVVRDRSIPLRFAPKTGADNEFPH